MKKNIFGFIISIKRDIVKNLSKLNIIIQLKLIKHAHIFYCSLANALIDKYAYIQLEKLQKNEKFQTINFQLINLSKMS